MRLMAVCLLMIAACKPDADGDGFSSKDDCNDADAAVHPDAEESCNDVDDDCDGDADEGLDPVVAYRDADGDEFGDPGDVVSDCALQEGYVVDNTDCDDADAAVFPGADEICNLKDDDCEGGIDEDLALDWYADSDGDGYGDPEVTISNCAQPDDYVLDDTDCDDDVATTFPDADEVCNDVDDDCDVAIDESPVDGLDFPADVDQDGFGDPVALVYGCEGVDNALDCDDADEDEPRAVDILTGTAVGPGTRAEPYDSIQTAIGVANGCVVVFPGTYDERVDFNGKNLWVSSYAGPEETIIENPGGETPSAVVTFAHSETSDAHLQGFTLTGGTGRLEVSSSSSSCGSGITCYSYYNTYCGGGIAVDGAAPTLSDLIVGWNSLPPASTVTSGYDTTYTYSFGGGVCLQSAGGVVMTGVDLVQNFADQGGGLYADAGTTVDYLQGTLLGNTATDGAGMAFDGATVSLVNGLVIWNVATDTGGGVAVNNGTFGSWNTTYGYNDAVTGGGLYLGGTVLATLDSAIVTGSATGDGVSVGAGATVTATYNDAYNNLAANYAGMTDPTGTSGNLSVDPRFTDVSDDGDLINDDWTLSAESPSIDAGNPARKDPDGTTADQGAYGGPGGAWK